MSGHFLFVRFWIGFSPEFPFERFRALRDNMLGPALEKFAQQWLKKNRRAFKAYQRDQEQRRQDHPRPTFTARPGINPVLPPSEQPRHAAVQRTPDQQLPLIVEVARVAGWDWSIATSADVYPPRRHALARFDSQEQAQAAAEALERRLRDLAQASAVDPPLPTERAAMDRWHRDCDERLWLQWSTPVFAALAGNTLSLAERAEAQDQIARLDQETDRPMPVNEALCRVIIPHVVSIIDQVRSENGPGMQSAGAQPAEAMPSAASRIPQPASVPPQSQIGDKGHPVHVTNLDELVKLVRSTLSEGASDEKCFFPASAVAKATALTLPAITRLCQNNTIRSRRPRPNRREVHVGDVMAYLEKR